LFVASELAPILQKNTGWCEENRRLHEESIEALAEAGIFRLGATDAAAT